LSGHAEDTFARHVARHLGDAAGDALDLAHQEVHRRPENGSGSGGCRGRG
jgi:hypothetical protein